MNARRVQATVPANDHPRLDRRAALGFVAAAGLAAAPGTPRADASGRAGPAIAALRLLLDRNILPFWRRVCTQTSTEGYELSIDAAGVPLAPPANRGLILQARTTFFFSRLARSRYGRRSDLAIATRGFEFLTKRMWDEANDGFYTEAAPARPYAPTVRTKQLVGHAHALSAVSEYALAAPSTDTRAWADLVADKIDERFRVAAEGEYIDALNEDWTGTPPAVRGYNARFRLLDALTSYHALQVAGGSSERRQRARDRLAEAVSISDEALISTPAAHYFRASTAPQGATRVTYNADLQVVHQLRRARAALGLPDRAEYSLVIDDALKYGEDSLLGGIHVAGNPGQPADDLYKLGFAQAETLLGTCDSWVRTGEDAHWKAFWRTLRWILRNQADWALGDWHPSIPAGHPATTKASPFHPGRAVLYSLELLDGLPSDRG